MKVYCIACLFLVLNVGVVCWGQVPPYQGSNYIFGKNDVLYTRADLMYRIKAIYPDFHVLSPSEKSKLYVKEEIPFYSIFNYSDDDQFELEKTLQIFNYRNYSSFKAPIGVKKVTYHLYNNLVDSVSQIKHEFFFNKKNGFLEKEVKSGQEIYSAINWNVVEREEYSYRYTENEKKIIIEKLIQSDDSVISLAKFTYSKDKRLLIKVDFLSKDNDWNPIRGRLLKVPIRKTVEYCYNKENIIFDILVDGCSITQKASSYSNYVEFKNFNRWLNKDSWNLFLGLNEDENERVFFPKNLDLNFKQDSYRLNMNHTVSTNDVEKLNIVVQSHKSSNIFKNYYWEKHSVEPDTSKKISDIFSSTFLIIRNEANELNNLYFANKYEINNVLFSPNVQTETKLIFISKNEDRNSYLIKKINKKDLFRIDLFQEMSDKAAKAALLEYNRAPDVKNELLTLKLKSKRGLNEVYLVKGEKVYPLITIN
ncbi:hypothetical protein [Myroides odoratus]|uniref:Uncharacterized protein n=1 Tax=Myroides odoratus TaxID=256 RepID=A0A9Q6Z3V6_MYROD|nr:hypothetical protein [Myroides odoratus]EHQ44386.1 hypothetical protein Myrod_3589 [Myroides odoratus DSM 2801]EKB03852.1 hypothetical protein HMPREF9716_03399 [Myroides odoratus CIP 103059]QQU01658.1 hypothetical protein I6I88_07955 [Myroides odoratus]WQD56061.1 hypothetical protein U0010_11030 [Myroides odoratus]STZ31725.1 Uncharacterised protein [Myroides odoratus]